MKHLHAILPACRVDRCALTVVLLGLWALSTGGAWPVLNSLAADWPTVKPVTALAFMAAGIALLYDNNQSCRPASRMLCVFVLTLMAASLGVPHRFTEEALTVSYRQPSLLTVTCFMLFAIVLLGNGRLPKPGRRMAAHVLLLVSTGAVAGYALGYPPLYGYLPGVSTGMALLTALGFLTLGFGLRERALEYERGD